MKGQAVMKESLNDHTKRIRKLLQDSATGPLIASEEVMGIVNNWKHWGTLTKHRTPGQWLRREIHPDQGVGWYKRRAEALLRWGKSTSARLHHNAAVWAMNNAPDSIMDALKTEVARLYRDNGSMYVTASQVRKAVRALLGKAEDFKGGPPFPGPKPTPSGPSKRELRNEIQRLLGRIGRLEAQVRSLGAEPVP